MDNNVQQILSLASDDCQNILITFDQIKYDIHQLHMGK